MRQNPHVRICGGPGSATTQVYPTARSRVQGSFLPPAQSRKLDWNPCGTAAMPMSLSNFDNVRRAERLRFSAERQHSWILCIKD